MNRYKVDHSKKNKPGMSRHIFALVDTLAGNRVIKESFELHDLMDECIERNTIIEMDCHCGGKIEISLFQSKRLDPSDDVICRACEG